MANELSYQISLSARKSGATVSHSEQSRSNMTGDDMIQTTQVIGTTSEVISFGEISGAPQMALIKNMDATNFVEIGGDSGLTVFKLKILAGKSILVSFASGTVYAKADTAAVRILIVAVEA